jgi:enoyl-CoA hydratase
LDPKVAVTSLWAAVVRYGYRCPPMTSTVRLEREGPTAWIVFDNPARRNALTVPMMEDLLSVLGAAASDDSVRVVVLRGAGEMAFVSGADIGGFGSTSRVEGPRPASRDFARAIGELGKPVIAALRGWCLGAGVLIALAADIRVAADDLRMGIPASKLGVAYPREGVARLVAIAGPAVAAELLMSGEPFDSDRARAAGLVNQVVPAGAVFEVARARAEQLAARAPLTLVAAKRSVAAVLAPADPDAAARSDAAIEACFESEDFVEGRRAFADKRQPVFRGR